LPRAPDHSIKPAPAGQFRHTAGVQTARCAVSKVPTPTLEDPGLKMANRADVARQFRRLQSPPSNEADAPGVNRDDE
jgi:hypothetical protein